MSVSVAGDALLEAPAFVPRILVFSTNNISDPGIDLRRELRTCTTRRA